MGKKINIEFKNERKDHFESFGFLDKLIVENQTKQLYSDEGVDPVRLAIDQPQLFWLIKYHFGSVDDKLEELGCKQKRRRRK